MYYTLAFSKMNRGKLSIISPSHGKCVLFSGLTTHKLLEILYTTKAGENSFWVISKQKHSLQHTYIRSESVNIYTLLHRGNVSLC